MMLRALNERVLVRLEAISDKTESGLYIAGSNPEERRPLWATVIDVSEGFVEAGAGVQLQGFVEAGERVLLDPFHSGVPVPGQKEFILVRFRDIVAVERNDGGEIK